MENKRPTFDEAMTRLEEIVNRLEKGDLPLEESMALFEEGNSIVATCSKALDQAEQKVSKMFPGANGEAVEGTMEVEEP